MTERALARIAAFDIRADGTAAPVTEPWPAPAPAPGFAWRWLHCDRTDAGFIRWAAAHLPPPARAALIEAQTRPRCEPHGEGLILTLRGINRNDGAEEEDMVALRLWVAPGLVVSARLRPTHAHRDLLAGMEGGRAPVSPGLWLIGLCDQLMRGIEAVTAARDDAVDALEEMLLDERPDGDGAGLTGITRLARSVIRLRRHVAPQREALAALAAAGTPALSPDERAGLREIVNRATRAVEELDALRGRLASLRGHVDSRQAARIGRNGFVLSVVAAVFLPLGLLTGLMGVNLQGIPGQAHPVGFWYFTGGLVLLGAGLWLVFRWLRWF